MKASELMVGDIVTWKGNICYVISVDNLGGLVGVENENFCELVSDKELEPVLLTIKILEANGYYRQTNGNFILYKDVKNQFPIAFRFKHFWIIVSWNGSAISLEYVHQLQHALRLCELNEFAENFKLV